MVSERIQKISVSSTQKVAAEAKALAGKGVSVIDLSLGEPDFPTPRNIKDAAIKGIEENYTRYTNNSGMPELKNAIIAKLKRDNNLDYKPSEIIVSSGAKQSIFNAIHTMVYENDEVIIPAPFWVSYPEMVTLAHGKSVYIETDETTGFKATAQQIENAITERTKLLILCNPSNPTGAAYTEKELRKIGEVAVRKNIFVIADEIYEKLVYDNFHFVSFPSLSDEIKNQTILVNGVSKAYSMTGWRIGFVAAPEAIIQGIDKIQSHSTSNAASISQVAAIEAFAGPQDEIMLMKGEFERRRNYVHRSLSEIEGIHCYLSEGAFYLFPNVSSFFGKHTDTLKITNSFDFSMYLLYEAGVAVVPGSAFGAEGYIRLSYATSMENLIEAVTRIKAALSKLV